MALDLAKPKTAAEGFDLHAFSLSYVMSLMGVQSVATLPDAVLFPKDPRVREKALAEGEKRLVSEGLVTPGEAVGTADYNEDLLSMAAAVADPRFSILVRRQTAGGERKDATLFFNAVEVVELTQVRRDQFRLSRIVDGASAFHRVRKMLAVPPSHRHADAAVELGIQAFERVRSFVTDGQATDAVDELLEAALCPRAATDFVAALAAPDQKGIVSVLRHAAQKVSDVRVLGFYLNESGAWLTSVASEAGQRVRIEAVETEGFIRRLIDRVAAVNG